MAISPELKIQYEAVLKALEVDREDARREIATLQKKLREHDSAIITIRQKIDPSTTRPVVVQSFPNDHARQDQRYQPQYKYALISVRWAILHLLSEASRPMSTADIAEALKSAGVQTKAANFSNNVSAMLSTTMREKDHEEVEAVDGKWRLTAVGRNKIAHIVTTAEFIKRCPWAAPPETASGAA